MKKIELLFLLMLGIFCFSQDTIVETVDSVNENYYGQYHPEYEVPIQENREETEFHNRKLNENFKDDYKNEKFNYDRIVKEKPPRQINPPAFQIPGGILQFLMYAVLLIIILIAIYFIFKSAGGIYFGKEKRNIKYDASDETGEEDLEQIQNNNFEFLINKAKSEQDYRKAIRYYYLWVLQRLTDRNLIKWHKDKTDFEYLQELKNHTLKEDFYNNTYIYDHTWYGNFNLNSKEFELAESIFQRTLNKIN
ncbi:hypothetical protein [Moheibacter sediminis]|uniref:DUF4129 domain-containing protein n=1 Tax=Moheibacter sediminis TaxID=1434700 RepID=A0A1W1ZYD0_9FLAO|nr:hypothetical protein [Moheibacter sediminis]SMC53393.1 hypothetical protein SAMN06296427_103333 [Moheibacter sediminis]